MARSDPHGGTDGPDGGPDRDLDGGPAGGPDGTARVVVYTRPGCHLCEVALASVAQVCTPRDVAWEEVDITGDPALTARFTDEVPVTFVDGAQHDFWRVDPARLAVALDARPPHG